MELQKRRSGDQYSEQKKSPGRLHTWKNDRKAGGGAYRHQCSCRVRNQLKCRFACLESVPNRSAVRKVDGGRPKTTTSGKDRYIILQAKRGRRHSASVIAQQLSTATGRQVSRFTVARRLHKGGIFTRRPERCPPLKVDHRLQWCREHKNWTTVNGVVFSLRLRVGSVPEAILNAFLFGERSGHGFIPVTSRKETITVVQEFLSGEAFC
ncbi:transposable element Tcb2 transposase [Trichonephila clavipes]|nr:transposable element Tcb2 transposase [Trichonephila clavipes]